MGAAQMSFPRKRESGIEIFLADKGWEFCRLVYQLMAYG
jgi:hypothetical protein